jgi:hypothetical protein
MMTAEEVMEKFNGKVLKFSSYYKYTFSFVGYTDDGYKIVCKYGGSSDEIYRYSVNVTDEMKFLSMDEWSWNSVQVYDGNNQSVFYHNNDF